MYQKIMVPMDGSPLAECVLPHVDSIAKGCAAKEVIFLRVVEPIRLPPGDGFAFTEEQKAEMESAHKDESMTYLQGIAGKARYDGVKVETKVLVGKPAETLADYAQKNKIDLMIIATHGRSGVSRWVWGSVADKLLRSACSPVMMIRAPGCVPGI